MLPVSYLQSLPDRVLGMPFLAWYFLFQEANKALFSLRFDKVDCSSHLILPPGLEFFKMPFFFFFQLLLSIRDTNFYPSSLFPMPFSERMSYSQYRFQAPTSLLKKRQSLDTDYQTQCQTPVLQQQQKIQVFNPLLLSLTSQQHFLSNIFYP